MENPNAVLSAGRNIMPGAIITLQRRDSSKYQKHFLQHHRSREKTILSPTVHLKQLSQRKRGRINGVPGNFHVTIMKFPSFDLQREAKKKLVCLRKTARANFSYPFTRPKELRQFPLFPALNPYKCFCLTKQETRKRGKNTGIIKKIL